VGFGGGNKKGLSPLLKLSMPKGNYTLNFLAEVLGVHVLLIVYNSRKFSSCFLLKLYNFEKDENMKTLNYGQKVNSVVSP
jgi:hypothetical protein